MKVVTLAMSLATALFFVESAQSGKAVAVEPGLATP